MGNFGRGGFDRGRDRGSRGGFNGGRSSFGGGRSFNRDDRGPREMFKTTCSNCGKECEVPFRPTNGKPVYCSDCFEKMGNRSEGRNEERREVQGPSQNRYDKQLETIALKLDKIISLLEPKVEEVESKKTPKKKTS